jgi:hypothetical protein
MDIFGRTYGRQKIFRKEIERVHSPVSHKRTFLRPGNVGL